MSFSGARPRFSDGRAARSLAISYDLQMIRARSPLSLVVSVALATCGGACGGASGEEVGTTQEDTGVAVDTSVPSDSPPADGRPLDDTAAGDEGVRIDTGDATADSGTGQDTGAIQDTMPAADARDAALPWPTCDVRPEGAVPTTIPAIWTANASMPAYSWLPSVYVTGVSSGGCSNGRACQIFVQDALTYGDLAGAAHHAIKLFISPATATHFLGIVVGDRVDIAAHGLRYTFGGQNELLLQVNELLRGCIFKTGTGTATPVAATLSELGDVDAYENKYGPVLVKVDAVSGTPDVSPTKTFGLWNTSTFDAGVSSIVSLSPFFLPGSTFTGLSAVKTEFTSVTGVFGIFTPSAGDAGTTSKYLQIYARTMADVVKK